MAEPIADHFSSSAAAYRRYRPRYPERLYETICADLPRRELAWDCASGSGQAVPGLLRRFTTVVASDASHAQLSRLPAGEDVVRVVASAAHAPLATTSVDLLTVAQALHWFAGAEFYAEVRRVLRPGGAIAAWTYGLLRVTPDVDAVVADFYHQVVGAFWPRERRYVESGYADLPWPFADTRRFADHMEASWTVDHLLAYLGTWSAVAACRRERGVDPVAQIAAAVHEAWGAASRRRVSWPISGLFARPG